MSSKRSRPLVPGAREELNELKVSVINKEGFTIPKNEHQEVKMEIAREVGVSLSKGYNGNLHQEKREGLVVQLGER